MPNLNVALLAALGLLALLAAFLAINHYNLKAQLATALAAKLQAEQTANQDYLAAQQAIKTQQAQNQVLSEQLASAQEQARALAEQYNNLMETKDADNGPVASVLRGSLERLRRRATPSPDR